jgi:hypothetical protein
LICLDEVSIRAVNTNENLDLKEAPTLLFEFSGTKNEVDEQIKSVVEISEKNKGTGFRYAQSDKVSIFDDFKQDHQIFVAEFNHFHFLHWVAKRKKKKYGVHEKRLFGRVQSFDLVFRLKP